MNLPTPDVSGSESPSVPALEGAGALEGAAAFDGLGPLAGLAGPGGPDAFDAELSAALEEIGRRVRPREFDSQAILRRTARGRSCRLLAGSAAVLVMAGGVTASFTLGAGTAAALRQPAAAAAAAANGSSATAIGADDPLSVPGVFRTMPGGHSANGFTQFGATGNVAMTGVGTDGYSRAVIANWRTGGVSYSAQVSWFGQKPSTVLPEYAGSVVGTVNGHSAYLGDIPQRRLTFWTGSQGYATALIFRNGVTENSATAGELLAVARSLDVAPTPVPMPIQLSGLGSAVVISASVGNALGSPATTSWGATMIVAMDGRSYMVGVSPGAATGPTPTGTETSTGPLAATRTVDGVGVTVTTDSGQEGSPDAPTVAQLLTHVTVLGADPSDWTTNVIVQ